jgi:hypothetical protein
LKQFAHRAQAVRRIRQAVKQQRDAPGTFDGKDPGTIPVGILTGGIGAAVVRIAVEIIARVSRGAAVDELLELGEQRVLADHPFLEIEVVVAGADLAFE